MVKVLCDICQREATTELKIKRKGQKLKSLCHFCDDCEVIFANILVDTTNKRMHQQFKHVIEMPRFKSKDLEANT